MSVASRIECPLVILLKNSGAVIRVPTNPSTSVAGPPGSNLKLALIFVQDKSMRLI